MYYGKDITIVGWGAQTTVNVMAAKELQEFHSISAEVIDLSTLNPLDIGTIINSIKKTGRLIVAHEAPFTSGLGAEISSLVQENALINLKSPIIRCCGYDTPFPLAFENYYLPGISRIKMAAQRAMKF